MSIEVGLEFFKYFPTYGVYRGIVVCVSDLEDDDGTRSRLVRCIYEDGDEEDIEFEKMQQLLARQNEIIAKKFKSNSKKKNRSNKERKSDETVYKEGSSGSKKEIKSSLTNLFQQRDFVSSYDFTLSNSDISLHDSNDDGTNLKETVNSLVHTRNNKRKIPSGFVDKKRKYRFVLLSSIPKRLRIGLSVFFYKCPSHVLGQVATCDKKGIAELIINKNSICAKCKSMSIKTYCIEKRSSNDDLSTFTNQHNSEDELFEITPRTNQDCGNSLTQNNDDIIREFDYMTTVSAHTREISVCNESTAGQNRTDKVGEGNTFRYRVSDLIARISSDHSIFPLDTSDLRSDCSLYSCEKQSGKTVVIPQGLALDDIFHWFCQHCTLRNSYSTVKCKSCKASKGTKSVTSTKLLAVAENACRDAPSVREALNRIPEHFKPSIPFSVIDALVSCCAKLHSCSTRCTRKRVKGFDYCNTHLSMVSLTGIGETENDDVGKQMPALKQAIEKNPIKIAQRFRHSALLNDSNEPQFDHNEQGESSGESKINKNTEATNLFKIFERLNLIVSTNSFSTNISSIEDAIFSVCNKSPFPLGIKVRRFFAHWGFHDGTVVNVQKQVVSAPDGIDEGMKTVLLYRVSYDDGDEEDFTHGEIASLRQLYCLQSIPSVALPDEQIPIGSLYLCTHGIILQVLQHITPTGIRNRFEGGKVLVRCFSIFKAELLPLKWKRQEVMLTTLQLNVKAKLKLSEGLETLIWTLSSDLRDENGYRFEHVSRQLNGSPLNDFVVPQLYTTLSRKNDSLVDVLSPIMEWSTFINMQGKGRNQPSAVSIPPYNSLHYKPYKDKNEIDSFDGKQLRTWDPSGVSHFIEFDPYESICCEICRRGTDEERMLLCDSCNRGYHTYCCIPVVINVPTSSWFCSKCENKNEVNAVHQSPFMNSNSLDEHDIAKYLSLPFDSVSEFYCLYKKGLRLMDTNASADVKRERIALYPKKPAKTVSLYGIHYSIRIDNHDYVLPIPLTDKDDYVKSVTSMVFSMMASGITRYSEVLVYSSKEIEAMNNSSLEEGVQPLNHKGGEIFRKYLENVSTGAFPPILIELDENIGFSARAMRSIPRHTILMEYAGDVVTQSQCESSDSDSLFELLNTGDPETTLLIDPSKTGNTARFLNGINNTCSLSVLKANVSTRRFSYNGQCRVILYTCRLVEAGDILVYDYNAGKRGKSEKEWVDIGFYDTSNFL